MTVTTTISGTKNTSAASAIDTTAPGAAAPTGVADAGMPTPTQAPNDGELMYALIKAARDSNTIHRLNRQAAAEQQETDQKDEADKLHEEASSVLATGITSGMMQVGSAAMQGVSAASQNDADYMKAQGKDGVPANPDSWKSLADKATRFKVAGQVDDAMVGLNKAAGDATAKDLDADSKTAAAKGTAAKQSYDNESDEMHSQKDLKDAILKAYDALIGVKAQNAAALFQPRA